MLSMFQILLSLILFPILCRLFLVLSVLKMSGMQNREKKGDFHISSGRDAQKHCCQAKCHLVDLMTGREVEVIYDCHKRGFNQNAKYSRCKVNSPLQFYFVCLFLRERTAGSCAPNVCLLFHLYLKML